MGEEGGAARSKVASVVKNFFRGNLRGPSPPPSPPRRVITGPGRL